MDLCNGRVEVDKHRVVFRLPQGADCIGEEEGEARRPVRRLMQQSGWELMAAWTREAVEMQGGERTPELQRKWH